MAGIASSTGLPTIGRIPNATPSCRAADRARSAPNFRWRRHRRGESIECILNDFERVILPGITHWNHPAFFAYFGITGSGPGILGELLASALNVNAMLWRTSPAATELEECVLDWLRDMLGLPTSFQWPQRVTILSTSGNAWVTRRASPGRSKRSILAVS